MPDSVEIKTFLNLRNLARFLVIVAQKNVLVALKHKSRPSMWNGHF